MAQILVIDDQEDIVKLVVKALELQNHKVTGFTSVLDLDKNSLPRFDLILLDIMMPDVDGLQFWMIIFASHLGLKNCKRVLRLT